MKKFAWPTFWAAAAAVVVVSAIGMIIFKKYLNKETGQVETKFVGSRGAKAMKGYSDVQQS